MYENVGHINIIMEVVSISKASFWQIQNYLARVKLMESSHKKEAMRVFFSFQNVLGMELPLYGSFLKNRGTVQG